VSLISCCLFYLRKIITYLSLNHNKSFINPSDNLNNPNNDIAFLDVPWAGVRPSKLSYALEPLTADSLSFGNVNTVDYLPLCKWGDDSPNQNPDLAGCAKILDLASSQGCKLSTV
jgi:hypothetical protein